MVLVFIAVFATFVSVSTNYSRCYRIKDEIVLTLEHYKGINSDSLNTINSYLQGIGYGGAGECPEDGANWHAFSAGQAYARSGYGSTTNYCIAKHTIISKNEDGSAINGPIGHPESAYYGVSVFFVLDWPILRDVFTITISGESSIVQMPKDDDEYKEG